MVQKLGNRRRNRRSMKQVLHRTEKILGDAGFIRNKKVQ